jgi:hypothetical protein
MHLHCMAIAKCQLGNITVEEFARVMKESGQNPTDAEVQQIIKEVDLDGDGTINFDGSSPSYFLSRLKYELTTP